MPISTKVDREVDIEHITILGAGSFGTAIASMFARNGHLVTILDRSEERVEHINVNHTNPDYLADTLLPENLRATTDPEVAFKDSTLVFHAIPIQVSKMYLESMKPYITEDMIIISMSKGIHIDTLMFMNDIIDDVFGEDQPSAFLSGPSFAKEIIQRMPTGLVIASSCPFVSKRVAHTIAHDDRVRAWTTDDVIGVEVGGALKNVYAIASGAVSGAGMGLNPTAMLITRGCSEIKKLAVRLGARPETLAGLSGIGDLMLTCFGAASRNRTVGFRLGQGETLDSILDSMNEVAEGVPTVKAAYQLACKLDMIDQLPLLQTIYKVMYEDLHIDAAVKHLMSLPVKPED